MKHKSKGAQLSGPSLNRMIVVAGAALGLSVTTAHAAPVRWELDARRSAEFISGTFVYDADTNIFSDINIESSDGGGVTFTILSPRVPSSGNYLEVFEAIPADLSGVRFLYLSLFRSPLTNAGGSFSDFDAIIERCSNSACSNSGTGLAIFPGFSDRLSLVGTPIVLDEDGDGVLDTADLCPGTVIPEAAPTSGSLGNGRHALTVAGSLDFTSGKAGNVSYATADTAGCSCEQIVDALFLGAGQLKNGCSNSVMESWVNGLPLDAGNP